MGIPKKNGAKLQSMLNLSGINQLHQSVDLPLGPKIVNVLPNEIMHLL